MKSNKLMGLVLSLASFSVNAGADMIRQPSEIDESTFVGLSLLTPSGDYESLPVNINSFEYPWLELDYPGRFSEPNLDYLNSPSTSSNFRDIWAEDNTIFRYPDYVGETEPQKQSSVKEPSTLALFGLGIVGLGAYVKRSRTGKK